MKILINENSTVTASALEKYIIAADLGAQVKAVCAQTMLAAVMDEKPDIVLRYEEEMDNPELLAFFSGVKAHDPGICRILIAGSKNLQEISEDLSSLTDEVFVYPFVSQELMMRLRRVFANIPPAGQTDVQKPEPEDTEQPPVILPVLTLADEAAGIDETEGTTTDEQVTDEPIESVPPKGGEVIIPPPLTTQGTDMDTADAFFYSTPDEAQEEMPQADETDVSKKSTIKKVAAVLSRAIIVVVILLIAALAVLILTSRMNDGTPTVFGYRFYSVLTGSMTGPFKDSFNAGSLILVKPIKPEDIKTGDIITFDRKSTDSKLTTHRVKVVNVDSDGNLSFTTKGDANAVQDSVPVPANIVKGKVIWHIPQAGDVIRFAQTSTGMIFTVFIPAGAIVTYEIYIFYLEHAERKKKKKEASEVKGGRKEKKEK
jgi:signal peptidase I